MVFSTLTTGIVEPIEGMIHYNYNKSSKININLKNLLRYSIFLQPVFAVIPYIYLQIDKTKNILLILLLSIHYIFTP